MKTEEELPMTIRTKPFLCAFAIPAKQETPMPARYAPELDIWVIDDGVVPPLPYALLPVAAGRTQTFTETKSEGSDND